MVFAPHQDDETLGCGGTIATARERGAGVTVVFLADGGSENPFVSQQELRSMRAGEALAATAVLGVPKANVVFLGYAEGKLANHRESAGADVLAIIERERPEAVFVPYRHDVLGDHIATHQIVCDALQRVSPRPTVYEYPVWFLCHWPLVANPNAVVHEHNGTLTYTLAAGWRLLHHFRWYSDVQRFLPKKRQALECHRSQMTPLVADPQWSTLRDVARGEWLKLFFQGRELFYCSGRRSPNQFHPS
jgi:LmbE family N-acetylglucosaminyl deacetylase